MTLTSNGHKFQGHSNRIYAVKFDNNHEHILYSGGWDGTV